jgi:hypothetical protein
MAPLYVKAVLATLVAPKGTENVEILAFQKMMSTIVAAAELDVVLQMVPLDVKIISVYWINVT